VTYDVVVVADGGVVVIVAVVCIGIVRDGVGGAVVTYYGVGVGVVYVGSYVVCWVVRTVVVVAVVGIVAFSCIVGVGVVVTVVVVDVICVYDVSMHGDVGVGVGGVVGVDVWVCCY